MAKLTVTNQSVEKTLQIIEVMARAREALRLKDIAAAVNMPASTTLRMVGTLVALGYAMQDAETQRYRLTLRFAQIGSLINAQFSIRDVVRPYLLRLSAQLGESACLAVEEDMEVIYIDVADGPDGMLKITQRIGKRAPMHSTGVGKLMLTEYTPEQLRLLVETRGLACLTPRTATSLEALTRELAAIRSRGYALDDEECELGARCVAAPLHDHSGKIIAAVSVSGPISRMTHKRIEAIAPILLDTTHEISTLMAYDG